jgi:preprotein translocase subunit SecG
VLSFFIGLLTVLSAVCSLFLICLVLIQRGKGGGLAGAFGGMGGSSAFGTKAGDVFTRVTIVVAAVWIVLSMLLVILNNRGGRGSAYAGPGTTASKEVPIPRSDRSKTIPSPSSPAGPGSASPSSAGSSVPKSVSNLPEPLPEEPSTPPGKK